jgi:hypothetical protein
MENDKAKITQWCKLVRGNKAKRHKTCMCKTNTICIGDA